jgi:hypothetical protein
MNVLKFTGLHHRAAVRMPGTIALSALLALSACGGEKAPDPAASAKGELLPRSVSDDMPPYDTVKSQPPLQSPAPEIESSASGDTAAPSSPGSEETEATPTPSSDTEAATPAPTSPATE